MIACRNGDDRKQESSQWEMQCEMLRTAVKKAKMWQTFRYLDVPGWQDFLLVQMDE